MVIVGASLEPHADGSGMRCRVRPNHHRGKARSGVQAKESSSSQAQAGSSGVTSSGATIRGAISGAAGGVEIGGPGPGRRLWFGGKCGLEPSAAWSQRRRVGLVAGLRGLGRVLWAGSRATDSSD
jgi:hypothetical protein